MNAFDRLSQLSSTVKERALSIWKSANCQVERRLQWLRRRFEHPTGFCFQIGDGVPDFVSPVGRHAGSFQQIAQNAIDDNVRNEEVGAIQDEYYARMQLVPDAPKWPTLNAAILPIAINNVRKRLMETTNAEAPRD